MPKSIAFAILLCALTLAGPAPAGAQTTALAFDSQPGDPIGRGMKRTWLEGELTFSVNQANASTISLDAANYPSTWWDVRFTAPFGASLAPGVYEWAGDGVGSSMRPGLSVSGSGSGCQGTGRFVIYEVAFDSGGTLVRFAADFEQHCEDGVPALFGAIRYKSTRASLVPFDGAYPVYALHVDASPFGRVSGAGIDCGNGGVDCDEPFAPAGPATLAVTPATGYTFLGWSGDCAGRLAPATIVVSQRRRCAAVFDALPGSGQPPPLTGGTMLFLDRQATSYRAADRWVMQSSDSVFQISGDGGHVNIFINASNGDFWTLTFAAPNGQPLAPGVYDRATRAAFHSPLMPGLDLEGQSRGCDTVRGRFVVYEIAFDNGGHLQRFAADFEHHCEGEIPASTGSIRFNAARRTVIPFDGVYPLYVLTIAPPVNGRVTGRNIDCDASGGPDCNETYATGGAVTLTATPDPGYLFAGWTGDCTGPAATSVVVASTFVCGAVFDRAPDGTGSLPANLGQASLLFFSQQGDYIGQGQRQVWMQPDTLLEVSQAYGPLTPRTVSFSVTTPDGVYWDLGFAAPAGQVLQPGDFNGATRLPFQASAEPGLDVSGDGRGCNQLTGRFRIYEVHFDATGKADRFAADFEQHCEGGQAALFGAIRFNSTRASLLPFDGDFLPKPQLRIESPVNGGLVGRPFTVSGWAINAGATSGTGVDRVDIWAFPTAGGSPTFLGTAFYGAPHADVGGQFGPQFTNSGFTLSATQGLAPGTYAVAACAHDTLTGTFDASTTALVTVPAPASVPRMSIDLPVASAEIAGAVDIFGWALDAGSFDGAGVDAVHVYAMKDGAAAPFFVGAADLGQLRRDVGWVFGSQFLFSGYHLRADVSGWPSGTYTLLVFARSTLTGQFTRASKSVTRVAGAMSIETPDGLQHVRGSFTVAGWAFDADAPSGSGVDAVHVYAFPGSGPPVFLGVATLGVGRPDLAARFGERLGDAGFTLTAAPLSPGVYTLAVFARSVVTLTFSQVRTLTIVVD